MTVDTHYFDTFGEDPFDSSLHAQTILSKGADPALAANKLSHEIETINQLISQQVLGQYNRLIGQVYELESISKSLETVREGIVDVQSRRESIESMLISPYEDLQKNIIALKRIHQVSSLLQVIERALSIASKFDGNTVIDDEPGLRNRLASIREFDEIANIHSFDELSVLKNLTLFISEERTNIISAGRDALRRGMETKDEDALKKSFHIFVSFNLWEVNIKNYFRDMNTTLSQQARQLLDPTTITAEVKNDESNAKDFGGIKRTTSGPSTSSGPNVAIWASKLWVRLEQLADLISKFTTSTLFLYESLRNQRLNGSLALCWENFDDDLGESFFAWAWRDLCKTIEGEFRTVTKASQLLLQVMQAGYPRILRIFTDCFSRLSLLHPDEFQHDSPWRSIFLKAFVTFESAYISRSLSRLLEVVSGSLPDRQAASSRLSLDDVDKIVRTISSELDVVLFDHHLTHQICKNIVKALSMFCMKCEQLSATDRTAFLIATGPPSVSQTLNLDIVNCLWALRSSCWKIISESLSDVEREFISDSVLAISKPIEAIMEALLQNLSAELETVIAKVHGDSLSANKSVKLPLNNDKVNSYWPILFEKLNWIIRELFSKIKCGEDGKEWSRVFASRVIELVIRHSSIVRPLNDKMKSRILGDVSQLELAISQWLGTNGLSLETDIPESHRLIDGFKKLLVSNLDGVIALKDSGLDLRIIMHHLLVRAHPQMVLPLGIYEWTELEYSSWIDTHSISDHLNLLEKCLDVYMDTIAASGQKQFCPEYTLLRSLFP